MTYVDTTLTPEAGYTYVNNRQIYDVVAGAMTTHPAWDYVEYVDSVSGGITYRRYVWKCLASQSGLLADFFVVFEVAFTTASGPINGWYTGGTTNGYIKVYMGETYSAGVLGKFVTNGTSVTLAADLSNPATFTLATYAVPASISTATNAFGMNVDATSLRYTCLVTKDVLIIARAVTSSGGAPQPSHSLYVGAYESLLSPASDPFPIILLGTNSNSAPNPGGGATRAPTFTPSTAYTDVLTVLNGYPGAGAQYIGTNSSWVLSSNMMVGTVGAPATTSWFKNVGGPIVSRLMFSTACTAANASTKALLRGYLKYVYGANVATHSYGDTFLVDGRVMVGLGSTSGAIIDTEAV